MARHREIQIINYIKDKKISFVYCAASVEFSRQIMNILNSVDKNIKLSISNNNLICCGEGICGACIVDLNGKKVKTCKAQIDSREYLTHIGGGWAGCAASISAKKAGCEVVLLERTDLLIGLGNVGGIMRNNGRYTACEEAIALGANELFNITDKYAIHTNIDFPAHNHATI